MCKDKRVNFIARDDSDEDCVLPNCVWMGYDLDMRVKYRIACEERGYPQCEARYASVKEWELAHDRNWYDFINI